MCDDSGDEDVEVLNDFDLEHTDGEIVLPFFAPANLSKSEDSMSSRLTDHLENLDLHETVLEVLDRPVEVQTGVDDDGEPVVEEMSLKQAVLDDHVSVKAGTEEEAAELKSALNAGLAGKKIRVGVEDGQDGEESQIAKFSRVYSGGETDDEESDDGSDGEEEAIFDDSDAEEDETDTEETPIVDE